MVDCHAGRLGLQLKIATNPAALGLAVPGFLRLIGAERWRRRLDQLQAQANASPYQAKVVEDHHWLEMALEAARQARERPLDRSSVPTLPRDVSALMFAAGAVALDAQLTPAGRVQLLGRLRDALNSGFGPLALEIDLALQLAGEGYDVAFPDLEGESRVDLRVRRGAAMAEIECKSLSVDAGRTIHRRDFYRFVGRLQPALEALALAGAEDVVIITLHHRFPADDASHRDLEAACRGLLSDRRRSFQKGRFFTVKREPYRTRLGRRTSLDPADLHARCRRIFGQSCHVAGPIGPGGAALLIMRSKSADDTAKPLLEALKAASAQLTGAHPGIVAVQFEDLAPRDLLLPHLRRRTALIANSVFHSERGRGVAGVYLTAFGGLASVGGCLGKPGFAVANPMWPADTAALPLLDGGPTSDLARLLGVDPATIDPDDQVYDRP